MSDRSWDIAKGIGLLMFGLLIGNASEAWNALTKKADNAATKSDITELRNDMLPVLQLVSNVDRNSSDIRGLDNRQRAIIRIVNILCSIHDRPCATRNAIWYPPEPLPSPRHTTPHVALSKSERLVFDGALTLVDLR